MNTKTQHISKNIMDALNSLDLSTERIYLKKFGTADIEGNVKDEMDPKIMHYIRDPHSLEETQKKTKKVAQNWSGKELEWAMISLRLKQNNAYMGMVCFRYESIENDTVEIGWRLSQGFHGCGYATEAARCLLDFIETTIKPHKAVAYCIAENVASSNIMMKLGMEKEGHFRQFCKLRGQWQDEAVYGILFD